MFVNSLLAVALEILDLQYCTVQTTYGLIRGQKNYTLYERQLYYSYRGIPFAKPPIDDLRFKVKFIGKN